MLLIILSREDICIIRLRSFTAKWVARSIIRFTDTRVEDAVTLIDGQVVVLDHPNQDAVSFSELCQFVSRLPIDLVKAVLLLEVFEELHVFGRKVLDLLAERNDSLLCLSFLLNHGYVLLLQVLDSLLQVFLLLFVDVSYVAMQLDWLQTPWSTATADRTPAQRTCSTVVVKTIRLDEFVTNADSVSSVIVYSVLIVYFLLAGIAHNF
jgi:hypothetical protein